MLCIWKEDFSVRPWALIKKKSNQSKINRDNATGVLT